jgi:hypothetical protein
MTKVTRLLPGFTGSYYALAIQIALDLDHPLRRVWPALNDMPDVDVIAHALAEEVTS